MATISTLSHPVRMFSMACVPRPPQPINPAFSFSLPWPRTNSGLMIWKAVAAPMLDARKDLRDLDSFIIHDLRTIYSIMQIASMDLGDYTHQPDLARASTIPARWYTDPAMLEAERRRVFGRTWQAVGLAAWAPRPGTYFACEIAGEPVLVTRAADGVLRAFSNVCRHRGSELCAGQGSGTVIRCPYHGWTYALDGRLLGAPEFEGVDDWDRCAVCLPEFQAEIWGPYVFVNLDPAAPPLAEVMGAIPREVAALGCPVDQLRHAYRRDYVIECNWKVYVDNYLEGYHLPAAHPSLFRELDYAQYRVETFRYYSSQIAPIRAAAAGEARRYEFGDRRQSRALLLDLSQLHAQRVSGQPERQHHRAAGPGEDADHLRVVRLRRCRGGAGDHRFQRRDPAGRHPHLRERAARPALAPLRPRPLFGEARERRPPFPRTAGGVPGTIGVPTVREADYNHPQAN